MWDEIEVVPRRPSDRRTTTPQALGELALLVAAAVLAAVLSLLG
ncbi:MAG: hypothetical protein R3266_02195 [Gemmatimonadota bacterium]|nr:hypothetical protein [Gemmatimonadota bacterium]